MDENLIRLVKQGHIKADNDLATVGNEFNSENPVTDAICYHSQQAVEKYLKSYLVALQIPFKKTHSITEILKICMKMNKDFERIDFATYLTNYAVELRYPDDFYIPDLEEAKKAYEIAKAVKEFVIKKIEELNK